MENKKLREPQTEEEREEKISSALEWIRKLYNEIEELKQFKKAALDIEDEKEKLETLGKITQEIYKRRSMQFAAIKTALRYAKRMDLFDALIKCWNCTHTAGHSGMIDCSNSDCELYDKYFELCELIYGDLPANIYRDLREKLKEKEINQIMYR